MSRPIIIAHRGASGSYPENTLLAFQKALEAGAKWLELDTQLVEGELVVFHDDELERTTNGKGLLRKTSLGELRLLDAGCGEKVPLLHEVLSLAAGRARVNVELKGAGTGEATAVLLDKLFAQKKFIPDDILASSLRLSELNNFRQLMPQVKRAAIYEELPNDFGIELQRLDCWSVHLHKSLITEGVIAMAEQHSVKVFAWTVNEEVELTRLVTLGVMGVFTDYPEKFLMKKA